MGPGHDHDPGVGGQDVAAHRRRFRGHLGVPLGGLVIVTSLRTLTKSVEVVAANAGSLRTVALVAWAAAVVWAVIRHRRDRRAAPTTLNVRRVDGIPTTVPDAVGAGER